MNYYNSIKNHLVRNEINHRIKDYSKKLTLELGKNYSTRTLKYMR